MSEVAVGEADDRLKGWKEIGQFLHTSDRTAQRWEQHLNLPVHRVPTAKRVVVFASRAELQAWLITAEGAAAVREAAAEPGETGKIPVSWPSRRRLLQRTMVPGGVLLVLAAAIGAFEWPRSAPTRLAPPGAAAGLSVESRHALAGTLPARTATLRLTLTDGNSATLGSREGAATTVAIPRQGTLTLTTRLEGDRLAIWVYRATGDSREGRLEMREVDQFSLRPGETARAHRDYGLKQIEWVKAQPPPSHAAAR